MAGVLIAAALVAAAAAPPDAIWVNGPVVTMDAAGRTAQAVAVRGDRHRDISLGPRRAARISPLASARKRDIRFTVHDDTPVTPVNPLAVAPGEIRNIAVVETIVRGETVYRGR